MELTFGQNLAKERKQAGISQEELAEKLHLTRQTISKWETGASAPDVEGLRALCRALDVSADRLVEGRGRSQNSPGTGKICSMVFFTVFCW